MFCVSGLLTFQARASIELALLQITFLSHDFHELWRSVMNICLLTGVKRQWAKLVLGG